MISSDPRVGDGSDDDFVVSGTINYSTLLVFGQAPQYQNLTINGTLVVDVYNTPIQVRDTLTLNGNILSGDAGMPIKAGNLGGGGGGWRGDADRPDPPYSQYYVGFDYAGLGSGGNGEQDGGGPGGASGDGGQGAYHGISTFSIAIFASNIVGAGGIITDASDALDNAEAGHDTPSPGNGGGGGGGGGGNGGDSGDIEVHFLIGSVQTFSTSRVAGSATNGKLGGQPCLTAQYPGTAGYPGSDGVAGDIGSLSILADLLPAIPPAPSTSFSFSGTNKNKLIGSDATMEYSLDGGTVWTACTTDTNLTTQVAAGLITSTNGIKVRVSPDGDIQTIGISASPNAPATTFSFNGANANLLMGSDSTMEYSLDGGLVWTTCTTNTDLSSVTITATYGIKIRVAAINQTLAGSIQTIHPIPSIPVLSTPADAAVGIATDRTLSWNVATLVSSYEIQVAVDSGFTSLVEISSGLTGLSQTVGNLSYGTVYYWRVRASNSQGTSSWSSSRSFTTKTVTISRLEEMVADLKTELAQITVANGYRTNINIISDEWLDILALDTLPCVSILQEVEKINAIGLQRRTWNSDISVVLLGYVTLDKMEDFAFDLKRVVASIAQKYITASDRWQIAGAKPQIRIGRDMLYGSDKGWLTVIFPVNIFAQDKEFAS